MGRANYLPLSQLILLNNACALVAKSFNDTPYLVGSCIERPDWRDVDVRLMLPDDEFDGLFAGRPALWSLLCLTVSEYLRSASHLPVDFQIQRMTEANEAFDGPRQPIGFHPRAYAGGLVTTHQDQGTS